ncbi:hypothetical protein [Caballeronia sp. TF1N1]|uniref:hypothetical protein n=1 Tax=Caballeronia sp. TF1N1 TaxID=2878153 RepID=UPI001FD4ECCE|nr:hypothetical protein [Caballeronia sp. TF1N1]
MALETLDLLKIVGSSAVVAAIVNGGFSFWRDHEAAEREQNAAIYDAIKALEQYSRACLQMIYIDSEAQEEAGRLHDLDPLNRVRLPAFDYPDTIGWKWIKPRTASPLLEFKNAREASARSIRISADYDDQFVVCDNITSACATLGLRAWALGSVIRKESGWPSAELHDGEDNMLHAFNELLKKRAERKIALEAKWAALHSKTVPDGL